jgi:sec-independent protein translocase protein TatA
VIPNIGPLEIGIVLVIALIVFGPKRLPDLGRSLGRSVAGFRNAVTDEDGVSSLMKESSEAAPQRGGE